MRLYLDENSVSSVLVRVLRQAAHDIVLPQDVSMLGQSDPAQLLYAVRNGRVMLTRNQDDFRILHKLIQTAGGQHPGILLVCRENNPRRDLSPRGIAHCIQRFIDAKTDVVSQLVVLNQRR